MSVFPGSIWFLGKSTLSVIVVLAAFKLRSKVSISVIAIETCFIAVTLWSCLGWTTERLLWAYDHYETLLTSACIIEALVLVYGAPWGGIFRHISRLLHDSIDYHTVYRVPGRPYSGDNQCT